MNRDNHPWLANILGFLCLREKSDREALLDWFYHNIFLGFSGVWMPLFAVAFFIAIPFEKTFLGGDLVMFAVTLTAVSLGFFVKETQTDLRKRARWTYYGLLTTMILAVVTRTVVAIGDATQKTPDGNFIKVASVILIVAAILLNYRLFTLELFSRDLEKVEEEINGPAKDLALAASKTASSRGISL